MRALQWTTGLVAAVLLPKCLACVAGYLAVGAGLMSAVPELCGATEGVSLGDGHIATAGFILAAMVWLIVRFLRPLSAASRLTR